MSYSKNIVQIVIAASALAVTSLAIGWGTAKAQQPTQGLGGGIGGGPMPRQNGAFQPMQGPGGPGGIAMTADGGSLFIVRGNELLKVQEYDLHVAAKATLPPPPARPFGGPRPAQGGFGGGSSSSGGDVPPPQKP